MQIPITNNAGHIVHLPLPSKDGKYAQQVISLHPKPAVNMIEREVYDALIADPKHALWFDAGNGGPLQVTQNVPEPKAAKR